MIDPAVRLRRAIRINDLALVKRILKSYPDLLLNPDFDNRSQTNLHIAAELGLVDIATHLLDLGHDDAEISRDTAWNTPLMIAAKHGQAEVGHILIARCSRGITWTNRRGQDALSIACKHSDLADFITALLDHPEFPASVQSRDKNGDTPLHHASAFGSLKALRILLEHGADPNAMNAFKWAPLAYSQTVAAEVYFKNLIAEFDRRAQSVSSLTVADSPESPMMIRDRRPSDAQILQARQLGAQQQPKRKIIGVRLVTSDGSSHSPSRAGSDAGFSLQQSPEDRRRAMTPTAVRNGGRGPELQGLRTRAASGD